MNDPAQRPAAHRHRWRQPPLCRSFSPTWCRRLRRLYYSVRQSSSRDQQIAVVRMKDIDFDFPDILQGTIDKNSFHNIAPLEHTHRQDPRNTFDTFDRAPIVRASIDDDCVCSIDCSACSMMTRRKRSMVMVMAQEDADSHEVLMILSWKRLRTLPLCSHQKR